jgi:hypothetical protein
MWYTDESKTDEVYTIKTVILRILKGVTGKRNIYILSDSHSAI